GLPTAALSAARVRSRRRLRPLASPARSRGPFEIDSLAQFLAGLEVRHVFFGYLHLVARFRIAPRPRRTIVQTETAEPADLDALPFREALGHRVEDHLDRELGVLRDELRELRREAVDQLRFGHHAARLFGGLVVHLGPQQCAEIRGSRRGARRVGLDVLYRLRFLGVVLGLDRQIDAAVLAVDVDDHRGDRIAFLQVRADVLDAVARDFRRAKVALDVAVERDHRALAVQRFHGPLDDVALVVGGDIVGERIAVELLDAERDPLALDVDREHHRLDVRALLVVAHGDFARLRPRQIGEMNETVYAAGQPDEDAEVGDRLDLAGDLVALLVVHREVVPRVRHALLHAERDPAALLVDLE